MTAVTNLPSLQPNDRSRWNINGGQAPFDTLRTDEVTRKFVPRKSAPRSNSSSLGTSGSISSSTTTLQSKFQVNGAHTPAATDPGLWATTRKKTPKPCQWSQKGNDMSVFKVTTIRPSNISALNESNIQSADIIQSNGQLPNPSAHHASPSPSHQSNRSRSPSQVACDVLPVLYLVPINGTFQRKTIPIPYFPDTVRVGRQTNTKTTPTQFNGYFDSKVLSRQHAEIWADKNGKIWIKDVKSSNGTFVNGVRLSGENRDSDPHELKAFNLLELGIDIISEDQKAVIHQKVSAKVEYAGFPRTASNYIEANIGDTEKAAGTTYSSSHGSIQARGKTENNCTPGSSSRFGINANSSGCQTNASQQRQMNIWLTNVTIEQIAKKLSYEMKEVRFLNTELEKVHEFLGSLLYSESPRETENLHVAEGSIHSALANNAIISDMKPRFLNPPAPPPQQPLPEKPEKPDSVRAFDAHTRFHANRPSNERSLPTGIFSPARSENSNQIARLIEALASANNEIELQNIKLRDMDLMLKSEKQARELSEKAAKRIEPRSNSYSNEYINFGLKESVVDQLFERCTDHTKKFEGSTKSLKQVIPETSTSDLSKIFADNSLENMFVAMREMKKQLEAYKSRAETAETEREASQKKLAEMVEKIRCDKAVNFNMSSEKPMDHGENLGINNLSYNDSDTRNSNVKISNTYEKSPICETHSLLATEFGNAVKKLIRRSNISGYLLYYHAAPFASMLGIVLIGVGIMSYLNGWQVIK